MKEQYKKIWVDALRSGEYKQGSHFLQKDNLYCFLGVLCDVNKLTKSKTTKYFDWESDGFYYTYKDDRAASDGFLPNDFAIELEISEQQQSRLSNMNDIASYNFNEIADYIEKNL